MHHSLRKCRFYSAQVNEICERKYFLLGRNHDLATMTRLCLAAELLLLAYLI